MNDSTDYAVIDLRVDYIGRGPLLRYHASRPPLERYERRREVPAANVLEQLEAARSNRKSVLMAVDCLGGFFAQALDIILAIQRLRSSGLHVVADVTGRAASAAGFVILAASYVVIRPHGSIMIHRGSVAPADAPKADTSSTLERDLDRAIGETGDIPQELRPGVIQFELLQVSTLASDDQIVGWLNSERTIVEAAEAVRLGFADEIGSEQRAREVVLALARGEVVPSPRWRAVEERLALTGR